MFAARVLNTYIWVILAALLSTAVFSASSAAGNEKPSGAVALQGNADTNGKPSGAGMLPAVSVKSNTRLEKGVVSFSNSDGSARIVYDLSKGTADYFFGGVLKIRSSYAGVQLSRYITSRDYARHAYTVTDIKDSNGIGKRVDITGTGSSPTMLQTFYIYENKSYILTEVSIKSSAVQSSNWMGPVVVDSAGGVDIGSYSDDRLLWIPFDNDSYVRYNAASINSTGTSFEACAIYDNASRKGLIVGSVEHDTWKTGVYYKGSKNKLDKLNIFGGASDPKWTHDQTSHGKVSGTVIKSPKVLVGFFQDWRTGLDTYASVNSYAAGKLDWNGGVPFGWNSWGGNGMSISYAKAAASSDFIRKNLMGNDFSNSFTTVNLDSNMLSDSELAAFAAVCHKNGQKAGIYWTPFAYWGDSLDLSVEGSSGYTYGDCVMKDYDGSLLDKLDGAYALDPTHPAVISRIQYYIGKFESMGFDYIKLDFMSHGALEGEHYNAGVQTGIQAYNYGMEAIDAGIGGSMFISLSIAPLFPYQYANSRRISCDTFGSIGDTEYMLNSVSYGWWMDGILYDFNDPDHMTLYRNYGGKTYSPAESKTRVTGAAIAGTVFLNGDDLSNAAAQKRAVTYLTNAAVNGLAKTGRSFRPVEGNTGASAADTFVMPGEANSFYIAVFNFDAKHAKKMSINLSRAGLEGTCTYNIKSLWDGKHFTAKGTLDVTLAPCDSQIFELNPSSSKRPK